MKTRLVHEKHGELDCHHKNQLDECLKNGWKVKEEATKEEVVEEVKETVAPIKRRGRPPKVD